MLTFVQIYSFKSICRNNSRFKPIQVGDIISPLNFKILSIIVQYIQAQIFMFKIIHFSNRMTCNPG